MTTRNVAARDRVTEYRTPRVTTRPTRPDPLGGGAHDPRIGAAQRNESSATCPIFARVLAQAPVVFPFQFMVAMLCGWLQREQEDGGRRKANSPTFAPPFNTLSPEAGPVCPTTRRIADSFKIISRSIQSGRPTEVRNSFRC